MTNMEAPLAASALAVARPCPFGRDAPVTMATFPSKEIFRRILLKFMVFLLKAESFYPL